MRYIYISPHLDDAILSAGGLIYEQTCAGNSVEIWTFMCGVPPVHDLSPFAQMLHERWGRASAEEIVRMRRAEDINAAGRVGATCIHFDFYDCIYRQGKDGEWLYPAGIFAPPHEEDMDLPAQIAATIAARIKPDDKLICQLALGHVDHVIVRQGVEELNIPLSYDADIPYLFNDASSFEEKTAGMRAKSHRITESGLEAWQDAVALYQSQISSLFDSVEDMREKIRNYWAEEGGIYLWERD